MQRKYRKARHACLQPGIVQMHTLGGLKSLDPCGISSWSSCSWAWVWPSPDWREHWRVYQQISLSCSTFQKYKHTKIKTKPNSLIAGGYYRPSYLKEDCGCEDRNSHFWLKKLFCYGTFWNAELPTNLSFVFLFNTTSFTGSWKPETFCFYTLSFQGSEIDQKLYLRTKFSIH